MQVEKILKKDINKSLLLLLLVLVVFAVLRYLEDTQGILTRLFI